MTKPQARVHLATVALVSFIVAFLAARTFTTFFPSRIIEISGLHIHHFWFGIIFLALGGWLGISYTTKDIDLAAAILYGIGGGLIVDEAGLLLTFGDYWTGLTWAILVVMLAVISVVILVGRFRSQIEEELGEFLGSKLALALAVFLAAISMPFILQTDNAIVIAASVSLTVIAIVVATVFFILQRRKHIAS